MSDETWPGDTLTMELPPIEEGLRDRYQLLLEKVGSGRQEASDSSPVPESPGREPEIRERAAEFKKLGELVWTQAKKRNPKLAGAWKRTCIANFWSGDDVTLGLMLLAVTQVRRDMGAPLMRFGLPGWKE